MQKLRDNPQGKQTDTFFAAKQASVATEAGGTFNNSFFDNSF
jgi:hypothetical protein